MNYIVRKAETPDLTVIIDYRMKMFGSFLGDSYDLREAAEFEIGHLATEMNKGEFAAWVAETEDKRIVACCGVSIYRITPKPWNLEGYHAFISSMYTEPKHRRQGLGGRLLKEALAWAKDRGLEYVTLHASDSGRSLYESFGFKSTNEMRLKLE